MRVPVSALLVAVMLAASTGCSHPSAPVPAAAAPPASVHPDLSGFWNLDMKVPRDPQLMAQVAPNTAFLDDTGPVEFPAGEFGGRVGCDLRQQLRITRHFHIEVPEPREVRMRARRGRGAGRGRRMWLSAAAQRGQHDGHEHGADMGTQATTPSMGSAEYPRARHSRV